MLRSMNTSSIFRPFASPASTPPSTLANAEQRVTMQLAAFVQSEQDLNDTRARLGMAPVPSCVIIRDAAVSADPTSAEAQAAAIIRAGARRRGELPADPPAGDTAAAEQAALIVAAGRKARNEL